MSAENFIIRLLRHRLLAVTRRQAAIRLTLLCLPVLMVASVAVAMALRMVSGGVWPLWPLWFAGWLVPLLVMPWLARLVFDLFSEMDHQRVRLEDLSFQDELTRLLNRRHFFDRATREVSLSSRHGGALSLLLIDIDRFAEINATHGRAAGDRVLKAVADLCYRPLRRHDLCARYGGEEFAILLPGTTAVGALTVAERLRQLVLETPVTLPSGLSVPLSVSIGVAEMRPDRATLGQLLSCADEAMSAAKHAGRNCCIVRGDQALAGTTLPARGDSADAVPAERLDPPRGATGADAGHGGHGRPGPGH